MFSRWVDGDESSGFLSRAKVIGLSILVDLEGGSPRVAGEPLSTGISNLTVFFACIAIKSGQNPNKTLSLRE